MEIDRDPTLDALRGLAAIMVVTYHIGWNQGPRFAPSGFLAVDFFFMLSGYVLGQAYEQRLEDGLAWRSYMRSRLTRVGPMIILGTGIGALLVYHGIGKANLPWTPLDLLNFVLIPVAFMPSAYPLNPPAWSLFFELAVNAAHAALLRWLTNRVLVFVIVLSAAAMLGLGLTIGDTGVGWHIDPRRSSWLSSMPFGVPRVVYGFGLGLLLHRAKATGWRPPCLPIFVAPLVLVAALAMPMHLAINLAVLFIILPCVMVLAVGSPKPTERQRRVATLLAGISYPLYAVHEPLLQAARYVQMRDPRLVHHARPYWLLVGVAVIALAWLLNKTIDTPLQMTLKQRRPGHLSLHTSP